METWEEISPQLTQTAASVQEPRLLLCNTTPAAVSAPLRMRISPTPAQSKVRPFTLVPKEKNVSDQLQQPSPVQIQMQPAQTPGFDIYAMLLQAHTSSLQNTADMRNHLRECNDRDSRNTQMFVETKTMNTKLFERMETHKHTLEESVNKLAEDVAS